MAFQRRAVELHDFLLVVEDFQGQLDSLVAVTTRHANNVSEPHPRHAPNAEAEAPRADLVAVQEVLEVAVLVLLHLRILGKPTIEETK
eukprot:5609611-Pyramimonas_sp.AAC.1